MSLTSRLRHPATMAVLLALAVLAVYAPALRFDFTNYDDPYYVTENPRVANGLNADGIRWAFANAHTGNWHPITWLSHQADASLFALRPAGHHATSILIHALNTILVFLLFRDLTGAFWRSAMLAALFGLHPLRVESVAWVSERKDVLSAFFGLLSIWAYGAYARRIEAEAHIPPNGLQETPSLGLTSPAGLVLSILFFALGLMSKAMLVT